MTREKELFFLHAYAITIHFSLFFPPKFDVRWSKNSTTSELHILICQQ